MPEQIELRLEQNGSRAVALADEDKLRQVLVNLLDNAIKYSPDGGDVAVELAGGRGRVRLTVRDRGLGIPPGERFLGLLHFGTAEREPAPREREPVERYVEFLR